MLWGGGGVEYAYVICAALGKERLFRNSSIYLSTSLKIYLTGSESLLYISGRVYRIKLMFMLGSSSEMQF